MNCRKCSSTLQPDSKYCSECGEKVVQETAPRTAFCPNTISNERKRIKEPCGKEIDKENNFCNGCGWKINKTCFQPNSKMCSGELPNGEPCSNIVTVEMKHCTQCGHPAMFLETKHDGK